MKGSSSAVQQIITAFNGEEELGNCDGWLVTFQNQKDASSAILLINILNGWHATEHPNILHMILIQKGV